MATSPTPRPAAPTPDRERLRALVEVLGALDCPPGAPATVVRVVDEHPGDADGELELGLLTLEPGDHPLAFLAGFEAPPSWWAIGVVCRGRARTVDVPTAEPVPVRVAQLVARCGSWASCWSPATGAGDAAPPADGTASGGDDSAPTGRVDDALRRSLGLPTPPPPASTAPLWATQWLDALVVDAVGPAPARRTRRRRPLAALLGAHPAVTAFDLDPAQLGVASLVAAGERLASLRSWTGLRQACADGRWYDPEVPADIAGWLDDGAFARWVLGAYPDLGQLRATLGDLLAPSALSVIDDALAVWGLAVGPAAPVVSNDHRAP
jgi:hypothetical protein